MKKIKQNTLIKFLFKDKLVLGSAIILISMYLAIFFAGFFSPYPENFSDRRLSCAPPSKIFTIDQNGKLSWPYTYNYKRKFNPETFKIDFKLDRSQNITSNYFQKDINIKF